MGTTNATTCTASGGWSGSKATSGSQTLTNLTSTATYTLTCTGTGGSGSNSATVTVTGGGGGTNPPAPVTPGNQWQLKFFEEFDGTDYDHTKLTPCFDWNYGGCTSTFNNGYEHYMPGQVVVGSGIARLIAAPLSPPYADGACYNGSCIYKSGLLATSRTNSGSQYLYHIHLRLRRSAIEDPQHPRFLHCMVDDARQSILYLSVRDRYPRSARPRSDGHGDALHYNNRTQSYSPNFNGGKNGACADIDYSQGYHNFGVDWEPTFVAFYIDGVKCGQFNGGTGPISNVPMQLILNHMVSVDWQRSVGKPLLDTSLTRELDVDYIHVWQQVAGSGDTTPPSTPPVSPPLQFLKSQINLSWTASHRQRRRHRLPDIPRRHIAHHRHRHELQQHRPLALDFVQLLRESHRCGRQLLRQLQHRERHDAGGHSCADGHSLRQPDINHEQVNHRRSHGAVTNATSCTGTNFTASGTSGSTSVSPTVTTTYSVTCTGAGGTSPAASATVTVSGGTPDAHRYLYHASPANPTAGSSGHVLRGREKSRHCCNAGRDDTRRSVLS